MKDILRLMLQLELIVYFISSFLVVLFKLNPKTEKWMLITVIVSILSIFITLYFYLNI